MSLQELIQYFCTEAAGDEAERLARWRVGTVRPLCNGASHSAAPGRSCSLHQCHPSQRQASLIGGSLFGKAKARLTSWCLALYLIRQSKNGPSALELKRHVGESCKAAWMIHRKIVMAMIAREFQRRLSGAEQIDHAHLGGGRQGGKPSRSPQNTVLSVAAVTRSDSDTRRYVKVTSPSTIIRATIPVWARIGRGAGPEVISDGLACLATVTPVVCTHPADVVGDRKPQQLPPTIWVSIVLYDLKTIVSGACKAYEFAVYGDRSIGTVGHRESELWLGILGRAALRGCLPWQGSTSANDLRCLA